MDWICDCDFAGRSKHSSVSDPDCVQYAKNPISYHSHPYRALCGPCIAMSASHLPALSLWLEMCGVNVLFGWSLSYVCFTVKRDQYARA